MFAKRYISDIYNFYTCWSVLVSYEDVFLLFWFLFCLNTFHCQFIPIKVFMKKETAPTFTLFPDHHCDRSDIND